MENATMMLAKFISELKYDQLSENNINRAKMAILDYIGALLAGYDKDSTLGEKLTELIIHNGGIEEATIIGPAVKVPLANAALANGVLSHVAELDDGHRIARGHPGVAVVSAALSTSEYLKSGGKDLITAVVAGYDIFVRIAASINPSHLNRGYHTTGTCGTLAACAAASNLLKLNEIQTANALGLAGIQASGLLEVTIDGQMAKALHAGKAAYCGVLAALLAKEGAEGPKSVIEGKKGFVKALSDKCDYNFMFKDLNKKFHIDDCYIKLYPSCRHTHAPVDAALDIALNNDLKVSDIKEIIVKTYPVAISFAGEIFRPVTAEEAKFSIPYCTCAALAKRNLGLKELESEYLFDPEIIALTDKVKIVSDERLEGSNPKARGAELVITLADGRVLKKRIELPRGEAETPVTKDELIKKFINCTSHYFSGEYAEKIIINIFNIDETCNINELIESLRKS